MGVEFKGLDYTPNTIEEASLLFEALPLPVRVQFLNLETDGVLAADVVRSLISFNAGPRPFLPGDGVTALSYFLDFLRLETAKLHFNGDLP